MSDIGWASQQLQQGRCVKRAAWADQYLDGAIVNHDRTLLILVFTMSTHQVGFWAPGSYDIIAMDWEEANPPEEKNIIVPVPVPSTGPKLM